MSVVHDIWTVIDSLNATPSVFSLAETVNWGGAKQITLNPEASALNKIEEGNFWSEYIIGNNVIKETQVYGKKYLLDKQRIFNMVNDQAKHHVKSFMSKQLTTPKERFDQSDIGKWYNRYAFTDGNWKKYQPLILDIFKYMKQNGVEITTEPDSNPHCKNALAMLKYIFERDFDKTHIKRKKRG